MTWRAVAGSTAGTAHIRRGIPGQDYCLLELFGDDGAILVAIGADGAGSASHGQRGAELACTRMLARIIWYLDWHDNALVHVGSDKSTNSCDAIRRIAECTPEQIVSLYKRVICADVQ
ncbi:MAG: protein phosphatase 2C domain-containing protein [Chloroflexi bacterium]|nr:protein phosphatase 2C domain-containing protein [Chloroflexota bacterium]